ncbi:MAG: 2-amino-4-hydroxy-6-hydroxymethyldihydropteridine diphosphokinase [Chloroflexi bacterium]|nr:2-amino-4-hydroxy-6-hydroxymethyldihydropteridine diphosphokinase [Chloroflexota bacterium]
MAVKDRRPHTVFMGLGSNLGEREENLLEALWRFSRRADVEAVSDLYETEPVGYATQPPFLNAVAGALTDLSTIELLAYVKTIEREMGREPTFRNGPRLIDIDILLYDELALRSEEIEIPHPRLAERPFVLIPLAEIAPRLRHPLTGASIEEMLEAVKTPGWVQKRGWREDIRRKLEELVRESAAGNAS